MPQNQRSDYVSPHNASRTETVLIIMTIITTVALCAGIAFALWTTTAIVILAILIVGFLAPALIIQHLRIKRERHSRG